jgi:serine/threonine protein kinase
MTYSNREDEKVTPELCQQCGLSRRTSGSMTSWIFNVQLCSCEGSYEEPASLGEADSETERPQIILNERYAIKDFIGHGGISKVYKAVDIETNKVLAIKMVRPEF